MSKAVIRDAQAGDPVVDNVVEVFAAQDDISFSWKASKQAAYIADSLLVRVALAMVLARYLGQKLPRHQRKILIASLAQLLRQHHRACAEK
jgi:hypothetical protein